MNTCDRCGVWHPVGVEHGAAYSYKTNGRWWCGECGDELVNDAEIKAGRCWVCIEIEREDPR